MAYQVLARKWRPQRFAEMVGQHHVLRALTNALTSKQVHHAYLFTGTRGVGKTTVARILAKSLNCEEGITPQPCGQCKACQEIEAGRFVDLIEVDAASRTSVEDTRDLLESVQYAPTRGRFKIYLIDEVHMLSTHSFNALLKTLEEPPPHIKFLFATTDPQKLLPTVLSRCLQFNLKRLPIEQITEHLATVANQEQIVYELPALQLLAKAAEGSLRDALSLLDQAIAYGGGQLTLVDMQSMLGTLDQHVALNLVQALANGEAMNVLTQIAQLAEGNPDFSVVLADILSLLQRIAITQIIPTESEEAVVHLAQQLSPEAVQLFYQIGLFGRRDLPLAPSARGGFEMVLLRMLAFRPETAAIGQPLLSPQQKVSQIPVQSSTLTVVPNLPQESAPLTAEEDAWSALIPSLNLVALVKGLAQHCELKQRQENKWELVLSPKDSWLLNKERERELERILQEKYGENLRLHIQIAHPEGKTPAEKEQQIREVRQETLNATIEGDSFVVCLKELCDAQITKIDIP